MAIAMLARDKRRATQAKNASATQDPEVLIVGPYPPPFGGVSAHVQRLASTVTQAGHTVAVLNHFGTPSATGPVIGTMRRSPIAYALKLRRSHARVIHYHHGGRLSLLLAAASGRRGKHPARWIVTLHDRSLERHLSRAPFARISRWALGRFDHIVAVNPELGEFLAGHGVATPVEVLPAYVPAPRGSSRAPGEYKPATLLGERGPTLVVSAYRITRGGSRGDLYGLDLAAEIFAMAARRRSDVKLAIFLAKPARGRWAKRYLQTLLASIDPELRGRVGLWVGEQLLPAFEHDVIYLRPTRADGDAVSVREALAAGVLVIASDVVARPAGVATLPISPPQRWLREVLAALGDASHERPRRRARTPHDDAWAPAKALIELYRSHLTVPRRGA
jgi:glycosyltransferase involved in cell wall biosynthesis